MPLGISHGPAASRQAAHRIDIARACPEPVCLHLVAGHSTNRLSATPLFQFQVSEPGPSRACTGLARCLLHRNSCALHLRKRTTTDMFPVLDPDPATTPHLPLMCVAAHLPRSDFGRSPVLGPCAELGGVSDLAAFVVPSRGWAGSG